MGSYTFTAGAQSIGFGGGIMPSHFHQRFNCLIRHLLLCSFVFMHTNSFAERLIEYEGQLWDEVVADWFMEVWGSGGDEEAVNELIDRILAIDPEHPFPYALRAQIQMENGDMKGALTQYNRILEIAPHYQEGFLSRAAIKREMGDEAGADDDAARAEELKAQGLSYEKERAEENERYEKKMRDRRIEAEPDNLDLLEIRARQRSNEGDKIGARADLEEVYRRSGAKINQYAGDSLAVLRANAGDIGAALEVLDDGIKQSPNATALYERRAKYRRRTGDEAGALADEAEIKKIPERLKWENVSLFTNRINANPTMWNHYDSRAKAYIELRKYELAIADLRKIGELKPDLKEKMGWEVRDIRKVQIKRLDKRIKKNRQDLAFLERRTQLQFEIEDFAEAIANLDRGLKDFPGNDSLKALRNEAELRLEQKRQAEMKEKETREANEAERKRRLEQSRRQRVEETLQESNELLEADPNNPEGYLKLAEALRLEEDLEGELEAYNMALEVDPDYSLAYELRASVRARSGNNEGAEADREEAKRSVPRELAKVIEKLKENPSDLDLLERSGTLRAKTGDFEGAVDDLKNYHFHRGEPLDTYEYINLARLQLFAGDHNSAIATIDKGLAALPPDHRPHLEQQLRSDRARLEYWKKLDKFPTTAHEFQYYRHP